MSRFEQPTMKTGRVVETFRWSRSMNPTMIVQGAKLALKAFPIGAPEPHRLALYDRVQCFVQGRVTDEVWVPIMPVPTSLWPGYRWHPLVGFEAQEIIRKVVEAQ